ncbi:MAG: hypothetical protein ACTSPI_11205, partial [Candidatus Heimdallarchaeaceae archaeon]
GTIAKTPPYLKIKELSFAYPEGFSEIIADEREYSPKNILKYVLDIFLPRDVSLALNRISNLKFDQLISIPNRALWRLKSTNDIIKISIEHNIQNEEVIIFVSITDSRFYDKRLISAVSLPVISRNIISGIRKGYSWNSTIQRSVLRDWKVTPFIPIDDLANFQRLEDITKSTIVETYLHKEVEEEQEKLPELKEEEAEESKEIKSEESLEDIVQQEETEELSKVSEEEFVEPHEIISEELKEETKTKEEESKEEEDVSIIDETKKKREKEETDTKTIVEEKDIVSSDPFLIYGSRKRKTPSDEEKNSSEENKE